MTKILRLCALFLVLVLAGGAAFYEFVLPGLSSARTEPPKSEIQKRKKTRTYPRLSCKIEYLLALNHCDRSIASEFCTGDSLGGGSWRR